jgi:hypothetical protein
MFAAFAEKIRNLSSAGPTEEELQAFLLEENADGRIYYAPFDWINTPRWIGPPCCFGQVR